MVSEASHKENTIQPAEQVNNTSKATETIHGKKKQKAEVNTTGTSSSFECDKNKKIDYFEDSLF